MVNKVAIYMVITVVLASLPAAAFASILPEGSLLCEAKSDMDEAIRVIANSDVEWLKSRHNCFMTNQELKIGLIDYDGHVAKIRFWLGSQSAIGYTYDKSIK